MLSGKVSSIAKEKGFGFISPADGGPDIFFHITTVAADFAMFAPGDVVNYELDSSADKPRASKVERMSKGAPATRSRPSSSPPRRPVEMGYVTKLRQNQQLGFISPDKGGPELLFGAEDVSGKKTFAELTLGESVRFCREPVGEDGGDPLATNVHVWKRNREVAGPELPENPKARRRKPTWRK